MHQMCIGTRRSALALWQANHVKCLLSIIGFVGGVNGQDLFSASIKWNPSNPEETGEQLAKNLINKGALEHLKPACHNSFRYFSDTILTETTINGAWCHHPHKLFIA